MTFNTRHSSFWNLLARNRHALIGGSGNTQAESKQIFHDPVPPTARWQIEAFYVGKTIMQAGNLAAGDQMNGIAIALEGQVKQCRVRHDLKCPAAAKAPQIEAQPRRAM